MMPERRSVAFFLPADFLATSQPLSEEEEAIDALLSEAADDDDDALDEEPSEE